MNKNPWFAAAVLAAFATLWTGVALALPLKEFRKFSPAEQGTYITAAVSMLAYSYAANGDVAKARCVKNWYFGKRGAETPGPREIAIEMGVAENLDSEKYQIEGVILGATDKVCNVGAPGAKPKQ